MNLEDVKHKLSASYERINNMKVAISRVESCKAVLMVRRDEVLAEVKTMMNEMAQQLLNLQLCMEATVNSTVEERAKFLDAKKQDILNANSYLVEVCMEADRLLKGRNEDLLGRACQRIFTRFERAWQQLDLAGKIDARSMASLVFKSNIRKFSTSAYVAKLQQLDQYHRVLDEQEFWVDDPSDSFSSETSSQELLSSDAGRDSGVTVKHKTKSRTTVTLRKSPEHSHSNPSSSRPPLETIQEIPEGTTAKPKREQACIADQRPASQETEEQVVHLKQPRRKEVERTGLQESTKQLPVVRIREADLFVEKEQEHREARRAVKEEMSGGIFLTQGFSTEHKNSLEEDFVQMDNMNMRSLVYQELSDSSHSSGHNPCSLDVLGDGGGSKVAVQSELEFWKVDSCVDTSTESLGNSKQESDHDTPESKKSAEDSMETSDVCDSGQGRSVKQELPELSREEEDFLWISDEEEKLEASAELPGSQSVLAVAEDGSEVTLVSGPPKPVAEAADASSIRGPKEDSQHATDKARKPLTEPSLSKNIALSTVQQSAADKAHSAAGQSALSGGGDGLSAGCCASLKNPSAHAHDISIIVGKTFSAKASRQEREMVEVVEQTLDEPLRKDLAASSSTIITDKPKDKVQGEESDQVAKNWSSRTTWIKTQTLSDYDQNEDMTSKSGRQSENPPESKVPVKVEHVEVVSETAEPRGEDASRSADIQRPLKTIRTKRLDISRMVEHTGRGFFECPAKLVEKITGDLYFPIGVATNSVGDVIVADTRNNLVKMYRSGTLISSFGEKLARPSALVVNEKDEIFVKDDHCVTHYDHNGRLVKSFGRRHMDMPYGMGMTQDGKLVVLDALWQNPRLLLFGQDGKMTTHSYEPLLDAPSNSKCRFLAVFGDEVLTSDLGCSCLYHTSLQGELIRIFGTWGYGPGELNEPSGVTVDSVGNWIVADSKNNRIQVFDPNGQYICRLRLSDPIRRPSGIHLSRDGLLYVINYLDAFINVYKIGVA